MANLIYSVISSLDGYIEDAQGTFDWAEPDEEVHAFGNLLCGLGPGRSRPYWPAVPWRVRPRVREPA